MKLPLFLLSLLLAAMTLPAPTLEWDAPSPADPTIVGYHLWWGTVSQNPSQFQDAGLALTATVPDESFPVGITIFFVARSYNATGIESVNSNEVSWVRAAPTPTPTPTPSPTPKPPENLRFKLSVLGGRGSGDYEPGQQVRVRANRPPHRYVFDRWIGDWQILSNPFLAWTSATIPWMDTVIQATYTTFKFN